MPEKPQAELKDIQEPSEKTSAGLEIVRTEELDSVVTKANELAEAIQQDRKITGEQVLDLEKDLGELKFDVCGEQMTLAEIREIPDFKHNYEIWQAIEHGQLNNYRELTHIISSIAKSLVRYIENIHVVVEGRRNYIDIDLNKIRKISLKVAEELVEYAGDVKLRGLVNIPDETLWFLQEGNISLSRELMARYRELVRKSNAERS